MIDLIDKVVWITGASSGIGEALAKAFSNEGAKIILSSRKEDELLRVKSSLFGKHKDLAKILSLDLADSGSLVAKAEEAMNFFGKIDFIIHSGGISQRSMAVDTLLEVDRRIMEINYFGAITLTKAILPEMIKNGFGYIIPISSLVGKFGSPYRSGYSASKHALHGFFDSLRAENYDKNIYVTIVTPGFINTNASVNAVTEDGSSLNEMDDAQAKGMSAEECARRILKGVKRGKNELLFGGKETLGVYIKRFFPALFARIIRKVKVR